MDPLTGMIMLALTLYEIFVVAAVIVLTIAEVISWFTGKQELIESDKANLAFTLKEQLANGEYEVIQGIFNQQTNDIVDGRKIPAKDLDEQMQHNHRRHKLAVYQN